MIIIVLSFLKFVVFLYIIFNLNLFLYVEVLLAFKGLYGYRFFIVIKVVF